MPVSKRPAAAPVEAAPEDDPVVKRRGSAAGVVMNQMATKFRSLMRYRSSDDAKKALCTRYSHKKHAHANINTRVHVMWDVYVH